MASNLPNCDGLHPTSDGLETNSDEQTIQRWPTALWGRVISVPQNVLAAAADGGDLGTEVESDILDSPAPPCSLLS